MGKFEQYPNKISNLPSFDLSQAEISQYFSFLKEIDHKFRDFYKSYRDEFKVFAQSTEFSKLKTILGEEFNTKARYDRNILSIKQKFVIKMFESLKSTVGGPRKKLHLSENYKINN